MAWWSLRWGADILANCNYTFDDNFLKNLQGLEKNCDKLTDELLNGCAEIIVENEKEEVQHIQTSDMKNSIKPTRVNENQYGRYIVVRPTGKSNRYIDSKGVERKRSTPVRNMEKFVYSEYGTSKQAATPIQKKVVSRSLDEMEKMAMDIVRRYVK